MEKTGGVIFIADGHIKGPEDPTQRRLVELLKSIENGYALKGATEVDQTDRYEGVTTLVLLGDIFEFWTDMRSLVFDRYLEVLNVLRRIREKGIKIIYMEGNHDFNMGTYFTGRIDARVYPNYHDLMLDGKRILLTHGDIIDNNIGNVVWRALMRSPLFKLISSIVPETLGWRLSQLVAGKSRDYNARGIHVERQQRSFARRRTGEYDGVIMGHSHVAGIHTEGEGFYANPGSIQDGTYLLYRDGEFTVEQV